MLEATNLTESFLEHLIAQGVIDTETAVLALDEQRRRTVPIGRMALMKGYLTMKQVFRVLHIQTDTGLRFGEQAIALGYLNEEQLLELLAKQSQDKPGIGEILFELGVARKGDLQKSRRDFVRGLEALLT